MKLSADSLVSWQCAHYTYFIEQECCLNFPPIFPNGATNIEEEVKQKTNLPPKDDLPSVSLDEVQKHIRKLKTRKASGLHGISNKAIKCLSTPLVALLVAIFNACLISCYFPDMWKEGVIIGLPKPWKARDLLSSYRPISLLSGLVERISEGFKRKRKTVAIFIDVAKAFDKVWQSGLIYKLYQLEDPDRLVLLLQNYLKKRHFTFRHKNKLLSKRLIRAGVPQGSILSSLLYSSYTNDTPRSQTDVQLALFADNIVLYLRGISFRSITSRLQRAIDELTQWSQTWRIECLLMPPQMQSIVTKYYRTDSAEWLLAHLVVINRCASRASRRPQPRAQFILKISRDSYAEEPLEGTHTIVTRRRRAYTA
ncbi:RNA-directed DNA polymerase from mobile element jockey [Eumeta japonica]|uniref:RNA-directed DNA polymerase from mobile element jockey n=1 Tax=Eumeta variegata TaxID=151549 RepID=A0A4C1TMX7_EUMVA|nr:RNA-directed DNA polymerase from mobile element jockey [Eumeta japonica]